MQTYEEAVLKTVFFWSDKAFRTAFNQNNGDDSENGAFVFMLMNAASSNAKKQITHEMINKFESKLTENLMALKDENPYNRMLDVDYHPNEPLRDACEFAGIDSSCMPCKTFTRIEKDNQVTAKYQYGGKFMTL